MRPFVRNSTGTHQRHPQQSPPLRFDCPVEDPIRELRELLERPRQQRLLSNRPLHRRQVEPEQVRDLVARNATLLRAHRLLHAHPERPTQALHCAVHHLAHPRLLLGLSELAWGADHPPGAARPEKALEELALRRDRLVHPCEHVTDVPKRVVSVQFDRAWETAGAAAGEGVHKRREERRLSRLREVS